MKLGAHLGAFGACFVLVGLTTWPLARDPAGLVPQNTDPHLFTWVMLSVFRNLLTRPHLLLDGSGFYPFGASLTFAEPLVTPALVAGPLHALTGQPYLAYNLTLLLFWAASGWAMYVVAHRLTGQHAAAAVAMLVFALSPPRVEYAVEFQMEIMFGLPLCLYALVRYLEGQRLRHLGLFLVAFWLQAIAVWYFAVILGCGLAVAAAVVVARRWSGWRGRTLLAASLGAAALAVALAPVAWPFFVTRRELGLERGLADALGRSADVLTYLAPLRGALVRLTRAHHVSETTLYPGVIALALAALAAAWWRPGGAASGTRPGWPDAVLRLATAAGVAALALAALGADRSPRGDAGATFPAFTVAGVGLLGVLLVRDLVAGWRRWRAREAGRRLGPADWTSLLVRVGVAAFLLSLGPVVEVGRVSAGPGLYAWLHPYVLPLRVVRGTTRFGLLVLLVVALLAALGTAWLLARLPRRARAAAAAALVLALLADYAHAPLRYVEARGAPRPVDRALLAEPGDFAILEWPLNVPGVDVDAKRRSLVHGKRVVNGFAGFVLDFHRDLSGLLSEPGPDGPPPAAQAALARIYPLRYVVVRWADLGPAARLSWDRLRASPSPVLRFRGEHGDVALFEVVPVPAAGLVVERLVAYDLVRSRPVLAARLRALRPHPRIEPFVTVLLNGAPVLEAPLDGRAMAATLAGPWRRVAPNVITFRYGYRRSPGSLGPAHRIGATGVVSPVDVRVRSAGQPHGDLASIRVGVEELAPGRRGYNLVALDPAGGVRGVGAFDTFGDPDASRGLAAWIAAQPAGTLVIGAVRDEASQRLDAGAVAALVSVGVRGDLRGRFRESHAFVGVKGAAAGTAVEAFGPRPVEVVVGEPPEAPGLELLEFALKPRETARGAASGG